MLNSSGGGGCVSDTSDTSAAVSVPSSTIAILAASSRVASSIPSVVVSSTAISRQHQQQIPVAVVAAGNCVLGTSATTANSVFGKKKLVNNMSSPIHPSVHTYSRPRILGRGREVGGTPAKILQQQTPPTTATTNNTGIGIVVAVASTSSNSSVTATEFGTFSPCSANNHNNIQNSQNQINNVSASLLQSVNSNNSASHILANNISNTATTFFNILPSNSSGGVGSVGSKATPANVNHPGSILIGNSPPCNSPPASKLVVRLPSLSPANSTSTTAETVVPVVPMQIENIQVVDEVEMENEMVQSVVEVEIDYQTLVALNDMQPAAEQTFGDGVELEIDGTTAVLDLGNNSPKEEEQHTFVISQDADTQVINLMEIKSGEEIDNIRQINLSENEQVMPGELSEVKILQNGEDVPPEHYEVVTSQQILDLTDADVVTQEVDVVCEKEEDLTADDNVISNHSVVASQNIQFTFEPMQDGGYMEVELNAENQIGSPSMEIDSDESKPGETQSMYNCEIQVAKDELSVDEKVEVSKNTANVLECKSDDSGNIKDTNVESIDCDEKNAENVSFDNIVILVSEKSPEDTMINNENVECSQLEVQGVVNADDTTSTAQHLETNEATTESADDANATTDESETISFKLEEKSNIVNSLSDETEKKHIIINIESGTTAGEELVCVNVKSDSDVEDSGILKTENEELIIDEVEQTIVETICEIATESNDNMQDNPQSVGEIDICVEKCSEIETAAKNPEVVVVASETPFTELSQDATTDSKNAKNEEPSSLDKADEEMQAADSSMDLIIDIDNVDKDKPISPSISSDQLVNAAEDTIRGKVDTNNASEIMCKKQSSEATLIPIIPIADEAYNGHETEKIVAATVPINEYEAQVVEPADPEPANICVVEQPPVIPCVQLLDEPPDEIEVVGKAALQWRNGVGILPGSNLKFKMNELGVMELIVQEDENENEIDPDVDVDVNAQANGHEDYDENNVDEEDYMEVERSNGRLERREFESTDQDSISDRSGSRSPEYHSKPPPRAKFSIMSNMKTSNSSVTSPFTSTDPPAAEDDIESCTSCGRFGLVSELTNLVCTPCITAAKKKEKFVRKSTPSSQSETTSEDNFKIPPQKTYVPQKSIYPIIPRNAAMSLKLKQRTETITTTMTNSAAIVLGIKDKAVMDSLNAGIGLACSKIIQESKAKNGVKNGPRKSKNAAASDVVLRDRRRNSAQNLSKAMPHLDCPEKNFNDDSDIDNTNKDMPQLNMDELEFEWPKYLAETKSKSAPQRLFRQPALPPKNPFQCGMILEAIDPQHQSLFCLVVVVETQGYRIKLRFIGFSEVYDFWMNSDSLEIFPCGWCEANNYKLETPPELTLPQDWQRFAMLNGYDVAPRENFSILNEEPLSDSGVEVGMRLEAVDIRNQNLVCVATVANVMGDRFLVHFDSWDTLYDYWTDVTSPFIHPVGWCEENNVKLTPPNNFKSNFTWDGYLKFTKCSAMPSKLFQPLPPVGFKKGMKIECVDKRNPVLVRVATVAAVEAHELLIHFDNFSDIYDYKVYELSPDIHPVGWCSHTGHTLQAPPQLDRQWSGPCKTFGCLAFGNIKGPQYATHNTEKNCPYAPYNYKKESSLPDRIIVYEKNFGPCEKDDLDDESEEEPPKLNRRALKPRSTIVTTKRTTGGKRKRDSDRVKIETVDAEPVLLPDALLSQTEPGPSSSSSTTRANNSNQNVVSVNNAQSFSTSKNASIVFVYPTPVPSTKPSSLSGQPVQSQVPYTRDFVEEPPEKRRRVSHTSSGSSPALGASTNMEEEEAFHSQDQNYHDISLKLLVNTKDANEVSKWETKEVVDFASRIPGCKEAATLFAEHMIDGESFLMLSQSDLTSVMRFKIGPAIKLANAIRLINSNHTAPSK